MSRIPITTDITLTQLIDSLEYFANNVVTQNTVSLFDLKRIRNVARIIDDVYHEVDKE